MSWTVIARHTRANGTTETRYARTYDTKMEAMLHREMIATTWADPRVEVVLEQGGPFMHIVLPCLICGGDLDLHKAAICGDCARWATALEAIANKRRARQGNGCQVEIAVQQERRSRI